jgi:hypothetical protein
MQGVEIGLSSVFGRASLCAVEVKAESGNTKRGRLFQTIDAKDPNECLTGYERECCSI